MSQSVKERFRREWAAMPFHLRCRFRDYARGPHQEGDRFLIGYIEGLYVAGKIDLDQSLYANELWAAIASDEDLRTLIRDRR